MAVEMNDTDLLHTINTLLNDEISEEEKPWREEVQGDEDPVSTRRLRTGRNGVRRQL